MDSRIMVLWVLLSHYLKKKYSMRMVYVCLLFVRLLCKKPPFYLEEMGVVV